MCVTQCGWLFDMSQMRDVMTTLRATRKGQQQCASNVHVQRGACQRTGARQALGQTHLSVLKNIITCLDTHCNACLKHYNSSIDQNQRNERDEDLLFVCLEETTRGGGRRKRERERKKKKKRSQLHTCSRLRFLVRHSEHCMDTWLP